MVLLTNWFLFRSDYDQNQGIPRQMQDAKVKKSSKAYYYPDLNRIFLLNHLKA